MKQRLTLIALFLSLALVLLGFARRARAVDIEATGLEVTQAVQSLDNSVRLVGKKNTWVRVHAKSAGPNGVTNVRARIIASRVAPGPVTFLGYIDSPLVTVQVNPLRTLIDSSFNIQLPYSWRSGTVHLFAIVDFDDDVEEDNEDNNVLFSAVTFEDVPPVRVKLFGIDPPNALLPDGKHYNAINSWLRRAFPTSVLLSEQATLVTPVDVNNPQCTCPRDENGNCSQTGVCANNPGRPCNDDDKDCGCSFLNELMLTRRSMDSVNYPNFFQEDRRYAALVDDDSGGFMRGCSPGVSAKVAAGPVGSATDGWDFDGSYADWYTAHELGHAYGRPHSGCCGAPDGGPYPYPMCTIGDSEKYGLDTNGPVAYSPNRRDVMSYCDGLWISDYTFEAILDRLLFEDGEPAPPLTLLGSYALAVGNVSFDANTGSISSFQPLPAAVRVPAIVARGDWEIRFLDAAGGTIAAHAFTPHAIEDDRDFVVEPEVQTGAAPQHDGVFAELVPLPAQPVHTLALFHDGNQISARVVSAAAPTVQIVTPNGGEVLDRSVTITWTARDADSDPLVASVLYSADDGVSWQLLSGQLQGLTSFDADLTGLPGGSLVRFRVDVSDGFHGASDVSDDVLSVADASPQVSLTSPGDATTFASGQVAMFEAIANDAEDGPLDGEALVWISDRQGVLGTGDHLEVGEELVPGTHTVTVTATDSFGNSEAASITIVKGDSAADLCPAYPRSDCDVASRAKLKLSAKTRGRRTLAFSLFGPELRTPSFFGAPNVDATQVFCLYDAGRLRDTLLVPPSATLWSDAQGSGFRYRNSESDAIEKMTLKSGRASRPAAVKASGRGEGPQLPELRVPLQLPVVFQLGNDTTSSCISAEFGAATVRRNGEGTFSAKQ